MSSARKMLTSSSHHIVLICVAGWFGRCVMSCPSHLPDARQLSDEVLQSQRLRALRGCELGYSEIEVAVLLGLSRETVSRWWTAYAEHVLEALPGDRIGHPIGSGRTLNDGQAAWLRTMLIAKRPEEVGIASALWTRRAVADLIRKQYGIDMPVRTVGEYLRAVGLHIQGAASSCQGSGPRGGPQVAGADLSDDRAAGSPRGAELHWCDETGAVADQQPRRGYASEGQPANRRTGPRHPVRT